MPILYLGDGIQVAMVKDLWDNLLGITSQSTMMENKRKFAYYHLYFRIF